MTIVDLAVMAIWPHTFIAGALVAGARWALARRRRRPQPALYLTQAQVDRVIATYERELQQDRS